MVRFALPVLLVAISTPVLADEITATVIAFDRVDHVIVLDDKTAFNVAKPEMIPEGLKAGDTITISYTSDGDNGVKSIEAIEKS